MEKAALIFSILTHDAEFMSWFWALVSLPAGIWHLFRFRSTQRTEKELAELSPDFKHINADYAVFSIFALGILIAFPLVVLAPDWDKWAIQKFGMEFYPSSTIFGAGYGIYQASFALFKGVYPMAKSLTYAYEEKEKIYRVAKQQILISIALIGFVIAFFFVTV